MNHGLLTSLFLFGFIATCFAAECTLNTECNAILKCQPGYHVICEHDPITGVVPGKGLCTCAHDVYKCKQADECKLSSVNMECGDNKRHCYDGKCICTRW